MCHEPCCSQATSQQVPNISEYEQIFSTMITPNHTHQLSENKRTKRWLKLLILTIDLKCIETWVNIVRLWHISRNLTRANFHKLFGRSTAAKRYFSIGIVLWFHMAFAKNNVAFGVTACSEFIATIENFEERVGRNLANAKIGKFVSATYARHCLLTKENK